MNDEMMLLFHAGVTCYMAGVIWMVQLAHYPLLALVGNEAFEKYEQANTRKTTLVVLPAMLVEAFLAIALVVSGKGGALAVAGLVLLIVIWLSTFLLQLPCHHRLSRSFHAAVHRKLVRTNWIRTAAWTLRAVIALMMTAG